MLKDAGKFAGSIAENIGKPMSPKLCPTEAAPTSVLHTPLMNRFQGHGQNTDLMLNGVHVLPNLSEAALLAVPTDHYVVFPNQSGTITVNGNNVVATNKIALLGQTGNIQVKGNANNNANMLQFTGDDVTILNMRLRVGASNTVNCCNASIGMWGSRFILDSNDFGWASDEVMELWGATDGIISNNIFHEGLSESTDDSGQKHGYLLLISNGTKRVSIHHNLFAHSDGRAPSLNGGSDEIDYCNNVTHGMVRPIDWHAQNITTRINETDNLHIYDAGRSNTWYDAVTRESTGSLELYSSGNMALDNNSNTMRPWQHIEIISQLPSPASHFVNTPHACPAITKTPVSQLAAYMQANVGAQNKNQSLRDSTTIRLLNQLANRIGSVINDESEVGGWPPMPSVAKNPWDLSKPDKLSDAIKAECGLTPATHQNTTQTNTNGGNLNDFLFIIDYCFGL